MVIPSTHLVARGMHLPLSRYEMTSGMRICVHSNIVQCKLLIVETVGSIEACRNPLVVHVMPELAWLNVPLHKALLTVDIKGRPLDCVINT